MRRRLFHNVIRPTIVAWAAMIGPTVVVAQGGAAAPGATPFDEKALHGDFVTVSGCESQPGPGGKQSHFYRAYHFAPDGTWRMVRTVHADPTCRSPMVTIRLAGKYSVGPLSAVAADAREAELRFDTFHVTLDNVAARPMLAGCSTKEWEVGLQQEVGGTPCLGFEALAKCGVDHDIAAIRDGVLYPGVRTPDMCKPRGRPTALQPTGAKRQAG